MSTKIQKGYHARLDDRHRLILKDARHKLYLVIHYTDDIFVELPCVYKLANKISEQEVRNLDHMVRKFLSKLIKFDKDENE